MRVQSTPPNIYGVKKCLLVAQSREYWLLLSQLIWDFHFSTAVLAVGSIERMISARAYLTVPREGLRGFSGTQSLPKFTGYDRCRHG